MRAAQAMPPAPSAPLSAVSPLVRSYGELGVGGQGQSSMMPRPPDVFTTGAFGPGTPMWPMGIDEPDDGTLLPRRTEYPVWWNVPTGIPGSEGLGKLAPFGTLRYLADAYPIARKCIEDRKKEIIGLDWDIVPTIQAELAMSGSDSARTDWQKRRGLAMEFFERPDRAPDSPYRSWAEFMEGFLEDRYVCDAVALYLHPPLGGRGAGILGSNIGSLDLIDGTTIRPLYDLRGGTPPPSTPAFQQYLWGVPRSDYATIAEGRDIDELPDYDDQFKYRELIYEVDHKRTWAPYGMSFIERALLPIQIGLARMNGQLQFWTEGSVPYMFVIPGNELISSPQQVRQLQNALNSIAGDTGFKQKIVVLPPGSKPEPMKPNPLADQFDELIIGLVAMQLGLSAHKLGIQIGNKGLSSPAGGGSQAKQSASNEDDVWLEPETNKLGHLFTFIIQKVLGQRDMQWKWTGLEQPEDESQKATDAIAKVKGSLISIDEGREEIGKDPIGAPETKVPLIFTATGAVAVTTAVQQGEQAAQQAAEAPTPREQFEAANAQAHAAIDAKKPAADAVDDTPAHSAAVVTEEAKPASTSKPEAPTSAKAQFAEIATLGRLVRKGTAFENFEPRMMNRDAYIAIRDTMNLGLDKALDAGRQVVDREHRSYIHKLVEFGDADLLNVECGRLESEGITKALAGTERHPEATERLKEYWTHGEGAAQIAWGTDGDFNRCRVAVGKHLPPEDVDGYCANLHHRATGAWPGHAAGESHKGSEAFGFTVKRDGPIAAGLAVRAKDTGRILMHQRAVGDQNDHAAGMWEFPGGRIEDGESPEDAAKREWSEETGCELPAGKITDGWESPNGVYRCYVHEIASERDLPNLNDPETVVTNPDDPDGDRRDAAQWVHPSSLTTMSALRPELRDSLEHALPVLDPSYVAKVGPKGYIHGWIFVGVPTEGMHVRHPEHGEGTVSRVRNFGNGHHSVDVNWGDHRTSHDAYGNLHGGEPKFVPRDGHEQIPTHEPRTPQLPHPEPPKPYLRDDQHHISGSPNAGDLLTHPVIGEGTVRAVRSDHADVEFKSGSRLTLPVKWQTGKTNIERNGMDGAPKPHVPDARVKPLDFTTDTSLLNEPKPNSAEHYAKIQDEAYKEAAGSDKSGEELFAEHEAARTMSRLAGRGRGTHYVMGQGYVKTPEDEDNRLRIEEATHAARARGIEQAAREKSAEEGKAFKKVEPPKSGWKKLTQAQVVEHSTAKAIESGTLTHKAQAMAKKYATNHEMHLLHDGSIVSIKKGSIPKANSASDIKELLDSVAQLRGTYSSRSPHHVSVGDSVNGRFGPSVYGNAFSGQSRIGISPHVFTDGRGSSKSASEGGWWMPEAGKHSTLKTVLAHEFGHTIDDEGRHGGFGGRAQEANDIMRDQHHADEISKYGRTNRNEQYAESFMEWHLSKGQTNNKSVQALAKHYGWKVPQ